MVAPNTAAQGVDIAIANRVARLEAERVWFMRLLYRFALEFVKYCDSNYNFNKPSLNN